MSKTFCFVPQVPFYLHLPKHNPNIQQVTITKFQCCLPINHVMLMHYSSSCRLLASLEDVIQPDLGWILRSWSISGSPRVSKVCFREMVFMNYIDLLQPHLPNHLLAVHQPKPSASSPSFFVFFCHVVLPPGKIGDDDVAPSCLDGFGCGRLGGNFRGVDDGVRLSLLALIFLDRYN